MKAKLLVTAVILGLTSALVAGCAPPATPTAIPTVAAAPTAAPTVAPTSTAAPTAAPTVAPTPTAAPVITPKAGVGTVTFTVLFDNYAHDPALETRWGFACLVETEDTTVLFDTGADGGMLLRNMKALDKDPAAIDAVVFSHEHADHTMGLAALLDTGAPPTVYAPSAFAAGYKDPWRARTDLIEVPSTPTEILPGFYSTGFFKPIVEQALIVQTAEGWVMVTGCAHPGVVKLARRASEATGGELAMVMGGFHLASSSASRIGAIIDDLRELGVEKAAPTHCSGDKALELFAAAFGENYIPCGVGAVITIEP
jgi:7,8-dihydropterin-6-yl-methyl-4-(beta-D-ribofuranosyl)aminobenzene 5'-phosphate synthase